MKETILITGAASGIGRATARCFAARGWFTGLLDTDAKGLETLSEEIAGEHGPGRCWFSPADVTDPESVTAAVSAFLDRTKGRLDLLFNCAGILSMGPHESIDLPRQKAIVDINLTGVLTLVDACLPALKATPRAAILTMSSASAVYGIPELAVYSATKHAIRGLTEALNIELAPHDIHVGDIMVSFVSTPMIIDAPVRATSLNRLGAATSPAQVAQTVYRAYYRRRVHTPLGGLLRLLILGVTLMPFAKRLMVRHLAFARPA